MIDGDDFYLLARIAALRGLPTLAAGRSLQNVAVASRQAPQKEATTEMKSRQDEHVMNQPCLAPHLRRIDPV